MNKVSKIDVGALFYMIICSMHLGLNDIILIKKASNNIFISMLIGMVLGVIPLFMYFKICDFYPDLNIYEKNKKLFKSYNIINFIIFLFYVFVLTISYKSLITFIESKYLSDTPRIMIELLVLITSLIACYKGLYTIIKSSFISFIISFLFILIIRLSLIKYVSIINVLPLYNHDFKSVIDSSLYYFLTNVIFIACLLPIQKSIIKEKHYKRSILTFYVIANLSLIMVFFITVSSLGLKLTALFRYPEYVLLKKISLLNTELHLENFLSFRWIFYMISLNCISLYESFCGIKSLIKSKKIVNASPIIISIASIIFCRTLLKNLLLSIKQMGNVFIPIASIIILIIMSIILFKCIKYKDVT